MNISELLSLISKKIGKPFSQSDLARGLSVTRQTIYNRTKNNSEITISELKKIEKYLGTTLLEDVSNNNFAKVNFYPDVFASCGSGIIVFSEEKEELSLPKSLIYDYSESKNYSMIYAKGDSMSPYINDGDRLIIEHIENNEIIDNKIYVFCYQSEIFVKRLLKNIGELIIKSDNPNYSTKVLKSEDLNEVRIIGKIVGIVRNI